MRKIKLTKGYYALVDNKDYARVSQYRWCVCVDKRKDGSVKNVYAVRKVYKHGDRKGKHQSMHRLVLELTDPHVKADHKDGNGLNNRRLNLRKANSGNNAHNQRLHSNNTSGYKGVSWLSAHNAWRAMIRCNRVDKHLGYFSTAKKAALAYDAKARELFGEFAYTNFKEAL